MRDSENHILLHLEFGNYFLTILTVLNYKIPTSFKRSHTEFSFFGHTANTSHLEASHLNLLDCKVPLLSKIGKDTGKVSGSSVTIFICMSRYKTIILI